MEETIKRVKILTNKNAEEVQSMREYCQSQITQLESDFQSINEWYFNSSQLAKQYLKDQLLGNLQDLIIKHNSITNSFREALTDQSKFNQIPQLEKESSDLSRELSSASSSRLSYKSSPTTVSVFEGIQSVYHKFIKDMFRKFKKILVPANNPINPDSSSIVAGLQIYQEKLSTASQLSGDERERLAWRELPENLPQLDSFPIPSSEGLKIAQKRYGPFEPKKEIIHASFSGLKQMGPLKLEDGSVYEGQWSGHSRVGSGKCHFKSGEIYEGYWVNDCPDLLGRMMGVDGDVYEVGLSH